MKLCKGCEENTERVLEGYPANQTCTCNRKQLVWNYFFGAITLILIGLSFVVIFPFLLLMSFIDYLDEKYLSEDYD